MSSAIGRVRPGYRPGRDRIRPAGGSDALRITRNVARWTTSAVLILACALGAGRAADEFLTSPSWSSAGDSVCQGAAFTGPWLAQAGLALALIFRCRRIGWALAGIVLLVLGAEPASHWSWFSDIPGHESGYLLYLATALAVFPVFYRRTPRHRRPAESQPVPAAR